MMCAMGRPRTGKRSATAHTTLSEEERAGFDRLVAAVNAELQVEMTDAAVLRMLINRAVKDRGLDAPPKRSTSPIAQELTASRGRGRAPAKLGPRGSSIPPGPTSRDVSASARMRGRAGSKGSEGTKEG